MSARQKYLLSFWWRSHSRSDWFAGRAIVTGIADFVLKWEEGGGHDEMLAVSMFPITQAEAKKLEDTLEDL